MSSPPATSLAATLAGASLRFGDAPAVVRWDGETLSYSSWWFQARALAGWMVRRGVGEGDRVALVLPSGLEYLVAAAAASAIGAIAAGVNPSLAPTERADLVELADPTLVLADPALADRLDPARRVEMVTACELGGAPWANVVANDPTDALDGAAAPRADRTASLVFTSGTTGLPKAARFTEGALAAVARLDLGSAATGWGGGAPMFVSTQFAHVGLMTKLCWYVRRGCRLHLVDRWRADDVLALVATEAMTVIGAVAPQVALMLRSPSFDDLDLSAVELLIVGGAASPLPLVDEARLRFGAGYSIRYSSTEAGGGGLATPARPVDEGDDATIGRPRGGIEASIRDDGDELPVDTLGELWIRTPSAMAGYWDAPDATAATMTDGWIRTGDLATRDRLGRYRLAGRRGDMYIRGGYNVFPAEVEAALADHPGVAQVTVVPRSDPVMGEIGVAVVVPRPHSAPPDLESLRRHGARTIARHKLPEALLVRSSLPEGATGKIDRRRLIDEAAAAGPAPPDVGGRSAGAPGSTR